MFGHREQDARELSGEGDGSNAFASSSGNAVGPLLESFALRVSSAQNAPGALDQERAESAAASLGDVPALLLLSGAVLSWYKAQVALKFVRGVEASDIIDERDERDRGYGPDAGHRGQPLNPLVVGDGLREPLVGHVDLRAYVLVGLEQWLDGILQLLRELKRTHALGEARSAATGHSNSLLAQ
jgi:hypothetical protein